MRQQLCVSILLVSFYFRILNYVFQTKIVVPFCETLEPHRLNKRGFSSIFSILSDEITKNNIKNASYWPNEILLENESISPKKFGGENNSFDAAMEDEDEAKVENNNDVEKDNFSVGHNQDADNFDNISHDDDPKISEKFRSKEAETHEENHEHDYLPPEVGITEEIDGATGDTHSEATSHETTAEEPGKKFDDSSREIASLECADDYKPEKKDDDCEHPSPLMPVTASSEGQKDEPLSKWKWAGNVNNFGVSQNVSGGSGSISIVNYNKYLIMRAKMLEKRKKMMERRQKLN